MKISFTEHAIDRFIERKCPNISRNEALHRMRYQCANGSLLKEKTVFGDAQVIYDDVIFIIKYDGLNGADCATILFNQRSDSNILEQEILNFGTQPLYMVPPPITKKRRSRRSNRW